MFKKKKVLAIIPARSGSKGLKNKNLKKIGGFSLVEIAIKNSQISKYLDKIIVTTDDPKIIKFQSKFFMLMAAVENGHHIWLVIVAVLFAAVSAYYYFKIIQSMYFKEGKTSGIVKLDALSKPFNIMLVVIVVIILIIGVYPEILIGWMYH